MEIFPAQGLSAPPHEKLIFNGEPPLRIPLNRRGKKAKPSGVVLMRGGTWGAVTLLERIADRKVREGRP